jgi:molybdopterin adenylyltransferase
VSPGKGIGERGRQKRSPKTSTGHAAPVRVAVLTVSDLGAAGKRADTSGDAIVAWVSERGFTLAARAVVPDESDSIAKALVEWADDGAVDLVLTTGGTGLAARDVTPEATRAVLVGGVARVIPVAIGAGSRDRVPRSALSRGLAGVRSAALIVNLPGSTGGVQDGLAVLDGLVEHAVALIRGESTDHG